MQLYGKAGVNEFLGDFVVYRNLVPMEGLLPPLSQIHTQLGLPPQVVPRKVEPAYGAVMAYLLRTARQLTAPNSHIERLVFLGDTRLLDGTAFVNICRAGGWPGAAFIGADRTAPYQVEIVEQDQTILYIANRWSALQDFEAFCRNRGLVFDEHTAVVIDLDKTAIGARGRNDHTIDQARVEAIRRTVSGLLGDEFDAERFQRAYDTLNHPEFHPFTADNQDYLAYICLILGSGLVELERLIGEVRDGRMTQFQEFIAYVDTRSSELPRGLRSIHEEIFELVRSGDPTPFKAFRRTEYRTTVGRMGHLGDAASVSQLLREEIVITNEVREIALAWRAQGCLLFGLSDKPDEASIPTAELAAQGYQPIHRTVTHIVGTG